MQGTGDCRWACSDCREPAGGLQGGSRGTAGTLQGDCRGFQGDCRTTAGGLQELGGHPKKNVMTRPRKISEGDCRGTAYYMFDCIGDCRGTLQGGLQGDCRKTPRGLQEDVPVNPGGKGAAGTLGPASADLAQHARTSCRGNSEGTPGGLQGALQGVCRKILGGLQEDVPGNPGGKDTPGTCGPACEPGFKEGRGACSGLRGLQGDCRGDCRGTAGSLQENCR